MQKNMCVSIPGSLQLSIYIYTIWQNPEVLV